MEDLDELELLVMLEVVGLFVELDDRELFAEPDPDKLGHLVELEELV